MSIPNLTKSIIFKPKPNQFEKAKENSYLSLVFFQIFPIKIQKFKYFILQMKNKIRKP